TRSAWHGPAGESGGAATRRDPLHSSTQQRDHLTFGQATGTYSQARSANGRDQKLSRQNPGELRPVDPDGGFTGPQDGKGNRPRGQPESRRTDGGRVYGPAPGPRGSKAHAGRAGEGAEPGHRGQRGPARAAQEDDRTAHHRGV